MFVKTFKFKADNSVLYSRDEHSGKIISSGLTAANENLINKYIAAVVSLKNNIDKSTNPIIDVKSVMENNVNYLIYTLQFCDFNSSDINSKIFLQKFLEK